MNKKLRELLDKINAKKEEVKTLAESGKVDEAKAAKDELQKLQDEFDILKDVEDEPTGEINHAVPVAQKTDPVHDFADAARHGFKNASSNEGTGADGGYTVPTDIMTLVNQYKEAKFDLSTLVDVETVMTNTGRRTYQTHAQHKGFSLVGEGAKIGQTAGPQFEVLEYTIKKYAGYMPVTNELLADSDANITAVLTQWLADEDVATRNALILAVLKSFGTSTATPATLIDTIKKAVNVTLGQAYAGSVSIVTNDTGLNYLDTLKDTTGRYLLSQNASGALPMQKTLAVGSTSVPLVVVPNATLADDSSTGTPFYVGDIHEAVKLFDRQQMSIMTSNVATAGDFNAFEQDMTLFRGIDRLDVLKKDAKAAVAFTCKVGE